MTAIAGVYRSTLDIPSLRATLSDTYIYTATVMPAPGVANVLGSSESHSSLDITVGKQHLYISKLAYHLEKRQCVHVP